MLLRCVKLVDGHCFSIGDLVDIDTVRRWVKFIRIAQRPTLNGQCIAGLPTYYTTGGHFTPVNEIEGE